jgi:hypothetical protein
MKHPARALPALRFRRWLLLLGFLIVTAFVIHLGVQGRPLRQPAADTPRPLEGRLSLVKELSQETVFESMDRLANFNDTVWVMGSVSGSILVGYDYDRVFIPRLNRVRKILVEARGRRQEVCGRLEQLLVETCTGYEPVYREAQARLTKAGGGLTLTEPDEEHRRRVTAPAAAYLLGELDSHASLKVMERVYTRPGRLPVYRLFLFYSMHLLASSHPCDGLTPAASKALGDYLAAAVVLDQATRETVPGWDAKFEESDFRQQFFNEDLRLEGEPSIRLRVYPPFQKFHDWDSEFTPKPEIDGLFQKLQTFVKLAYPQG